MNFTTEIRVGWVSPGSPGTLISDVQNLSLRWGRAKLTDSFSATTAVISGRRPDLLPTVSVGDGVNVAVYDPVFGGGYAGGFRVQDYRVIYGRTPSEDRWEIYCEDAIADLGRSYITTSFTAGQGTITALSTVLTAAGVSNFGSGGSSKVSAQSFTNQNALDIANKLLRTEQGAIYQGGVGELNMVSRAIRPQFVYTFTDGSTAASGFEYQQLEFTGIAENYSTKIVVEPDGLAAQTAGTGTRVTTFDTYDQTTTQAANLALYIDGLLGYAEDAPSTLTFIGKTLTSSGPLQYVGVAQLYGLTIIFRTNTYYATIYGGTMSVTPDDVRVTFNLIGADMNNYFTLNSPAFGILDQNRLGF